MVGLERGQTSLVDMSKFIEINLKKLSQNDSFITACVSEVTIRIDNYR